MVVDSRTMTDTDSYAFAHLILWANEGRTEAFTELYESFRSLFF